MIHVACPRCGTATFLQPNLAGQHIACHKCGQRLQVPISPQPPAAVVTPRSPPVVVNVPAPPSRIAAPARDATDSKRWNRNAFALGALAVVVAASAVVIAVNQRPAPQREPGGDPSRPVVPAETPGQKRARLEAARQELMEEVTLLAGEGVTTDPFLLLTRCEQQRTRIKKLIDIARELGEPTDGWETILSRIDRLERLARLKAGVPD